MTEAAAVAMIAYTIDTVRPGQGSGSPPVLHRDPAQDGGAQRRAGPAAGGLGYSHARARDDPGPLPHRDRDLPRGERADLRRAGGAERPLPADHRLDDGGVGRAGAPAAAAAAVPQEPGPRGSGAGVPGGHPALHRAARAAGGPVRPDVRAAPAGGPERGLRQFPGLHLPGQVPLRLHPGRLRALPRRGRAHGRAGGGADAGDPPQAARARRAAALGPGGRSLPAERRCGRSTTCRSSWARRAGCSTAWTRCWAASSRP